MALEEIQSGSPPQGRELTQALKELQGLTFSLIEGEQADTDITLDGYSAEGGDTIVSVLFFDKSAPDLLDLTSELAEGSDDDAFQLDTTDTSTSGDKLLVIWFNKGDL